MPSSIFSSDIKLKKCYYPYSDVSFIALSGSGIRHSLQPRNIYLTDIRSIKSIIPHERGTKLKLVLFAYARVTKKQYLLGSYCD